jgi:hypothetical protein
MRIPANIGAGDRDRTGDIQLGKLASTPRPMANQWFTAGTVGQSAAQWALIEHNSEHKSCAVAFAHAGEEPLFVKAKRAREIASRFFRGLQPRRGARERMTRESLLGGCIAFRVPTRSLAGPAAPEACPDIDRMNTSDFFLSPIAMQFSTEGEPPES